MVEAFTGPHGFQRNVGIIIYDCDISQHAPHVRTFLRRCVGKRIAINSDKCHFSQSTVTFAGFHISSDSCQIDKAITKAMATTLTQGYHQSYFWFSYTN